MEESMRTKRRELTDAVVRAARDVINMVEWKDEPVLDELVFAVSRLDDLEPGEIDTSNHAANVPGRDTQHIAAALAMPRQKSVRRQVLTLAQSFTFGITDEMCEWVLTKVSHQTLSSARNWLVENGWLMDSGLRASNRSNRPAILWVLTPAAETRLSQED